MPEEDTLDDAIRNRLFEMMPKYPSKDACKMHLRKEGFPQEAVERVVDETFAIRKSVVMRRMNDEIDQTRILVSILDGEAPIPSDADKLLPVAQAYAAKLARDQRNLRLLLRGYLAVAVVCALVALYAPLVMLTIVMVLFKRVLLAVAIIGAVLGGIVNAINSFGRLKLANEREAALRLLAESQDWSDLLHEM